MSHHARIVELPVPHHVEHHGGGTSLMVRSSRWSPRPMRSLDRNGRYCCGRVLGQVAVEPVVDGLEVPGSSP